MRNALLSLVALMAVMPAMQAQFISLDNARKVAAPMSTLEMTGEEIIPYQPLTAQNVGDIDHLQSRELVIQRQIIGLTQYDLQSNYAVDDRVYSSSGGVSAGWIQSLECTKVRGNSLWERQTGKKLGRPGQKIRKNEKWPFSGRRIFSRIIILDRSWEL